MAVSAGIAIAGLGLGAYQYFHGLSQKKKDDAAAMDALRHRPDYAISPYATTAYNDAQSRLNAISPYVLAAQQQTNQGVANQMGYAERNAASGVQALGVGAGASADAQTIYPELAKVQQDYEARNRENYLTAVSGMDKQHEMAYDSAMGKYSDAFNYGLGKVGADSANMGQGISLAATGLASLAGNTNLRKIGGNTNARVAASRAYENRNSLSNLSGVAGYEPFRISPLVQPNPQYSSYFSVN